MADIAKLEAARTTAKPVVKAILIDQDPEFILVKIPRKVLVTDVRENINEEKKKTSFSVTMLPYTPKGEQAGTFKVHLINADNTAYKDANFALGTINMGFRGLVG